MTIHDKHLCQDPSYVTFCDFLQRKNNMTNTCTTKAKTYNKNKKLLIMKYLQISLVSCIAIYNPISTVSYLAFKTIIFQLMSNICSLFNDQDVPHVLDPS